MLAVMEIAISLRRGSPIDTAWRRHNRVGGRVEGLQFSLKNNVFVAVGEPPAGSLEKLSLNPSVLVEMTSVAPPPPESESMPLIEAPDAPRRRGRPPGVRK